MAMVHRHYLTNFLLLLLLLCMSPVVAGSQAVCQTAKDVEAMNKGGVSRLFELQGIEAKIFLALDPRLLMYEELFHSLMLQDIDSIVAWKLKRQSGLAAAVPFAGGCAAHGYGEPDWREKIDLMRDVVILIRKRGLDDQRVLDKMTKLVAFEQSAAAPGELRKQVEQIIERVRSLYESDIEAAVRKGDLDEVRQLIEAGTDINTTDETGATPLHWAADASHTAIAELLISKGADVNATANDGFRPLHFAANAGSTAMAELLISEGAEINATENVGLGALHIAAYAGHATMAELLIGKGADIDARAMNETTPLHFAAYEGHTAIAELLITNGADVNAGNEGGITPLHMAAAMDNTAIAELLISSGGDVDARTKDGLTPRDYAVTEGHNKLADLLQEHEAQGR